MSSVHVLQKKINELEQSLGCFRVYGDALRSDLNAAEKKNVQLQKRVVQTTLEIGKMKEKYLAKLNVIYNEAPKRCHNWSVKKKIEKELKELGVKL